MNTPDVPPQRFDKTTLSLAPLCDKSDLKAYWLSRSPQERIHYIETLRRMNYGHRATARLQRVLEATQVTWR